MRHLFRGVGTNLLFISFIASTTQAYSQQKDTAAPKFNSNVVVAPSDNSHAASYYHLSWSITPSAPAGTQFKVLRGDVPGHPIDLSETDPTYIPGPKAVMVPDASGNYAFDITKSSPNVENDFEIIAFDANDKTIANSVVLKGAAIPAPTNNVSDGVVTAPLLNVDCPKSTDTVINTCLSIDNFGSLSGSGYEAYVHPSIGTMTYPKAGKMPTMQAKGKTGVSCGVDPDANAVLYNIVKYNADQTAASSQWYLYEPNSNKIGYPYHWSSVKFSDPTRLYGITKLQVVSVLLNAVSPKSATAPTATYIIQSTKTQPTNVGNFLALLSIVGGNGTLADASRATLSTPSDYVGCETVDTGFSTSTLQVTANIPDGKHTKLLTASNTITNEAKAWWDISLALPVKKASALQYNSTAGTVTPTQLNKQSLFATADFYPFRTDLKAAYSWSPAFFVGVSLASKPLDSILTGASIHFSLASVYAGALWIKQQQLNNGLGTGSAATPTQLSAATTFAFQHSFSVGIKLSTRTTASQLSSAKK